VLVRTGREGLAARAGHDLTLEVTAWSARVVVPPAADGGLAAASITASLDLGSLVVREGTGGAKPLTDRDRREIEKQARKVLGAATASFASAQVVLTPSSAEPGGEVAGTLTLLGTERAFTVAVSGAGAGRYRGRAALRQTEYGITPYSGFFGALKLRDEVTIEVEVTIGEG
jgi:hypothetical protein